MTITKSGAIYRRTFLIIRLFPRLGQSIFPSSIEKDPGMYSQSRCPPIIPSWPNANRRESDSERSGISLSYAAFSLIGITGSNGKSITVALIGHILNRAGFSALLEAILGHL